MTYARVIISKFEITSRRAPARANHLQSKQPPQHSWRVLMIEHNNDQLFGLVVVGFCSSHYASSLGVEAIAKNYLEAVHTEIKCMNVKMRGEKCAIATIKSEA